MNRFENFTASEQITLELGLQEWAEYIAGNIEKFPHCPDVPNWNKALLRATRLQNEILSLWAEKRRSLESA